MNVSHKHADRSAECDDAGAIEAVVDKVNGLVPWLAQQSARIDAERRIPDDVIARIVGTGLFRLAQPQCYGGLGARPSIIWNTTFAVARGNPSCAWITGLGAANALAMARFSHQAQSDVFNLSEAPIFSLLSGGVGANVVVERHGDHMTVSGDWRYASGIDVSSWVGTLIEIPPEDGMGPSVPHMALIPTSAFAVDHDSWRVIGMRGTGSKNVRLDNCVVPMHRIMDWAALQADACDPTCRNREVAQGFPFNTMLAMSVIAPTLGTAAAAAEAVLDIIRNRVNSGTKKKQVEDNVTHVRVATAVARIGMLQRFVIAATEDIERRIEADAPISVEDRAKIRTQFAVAARDALTTCQELFALIGGSLLPEGTRLDGLFRDIHTMSTHFLLQPDITGEAYGRLLLGLELKPGTRI